MPGGYVRDIVERVTPSILMGRHAGLNRVDEFEAYHVKETVNQLQMRSAAISNGLAAGTQAIVGATYHLSRRSRGAAQPSRQHRRSLRISLRT